VIRLLDQLRRPCSGAVLTFAAAALLSCGGGSDAPTGPEPPVDEGETPVAGCKDGVLEHGALYRICFPATWNGDLAMYAHGYVAPGSPIALPDDQIGGQSISAAVNGLGYAFATTSYRANGLVAAEAKEDLVELDATVRRLYRPDPGKTLLVGISEGGLVATLAAEQHGDLFDGALAACGPVGDIRSQLDHFVDFRVVFDYLFPGVIPGSPIDVPESVQSGWSSIYAPAVGMALAANPAAARQLVNITATPVAGGGIEPIVEAAIGLLWYNVYGSTDAESRLGGQPFDNVNRVYSGSADDAALNAGIERFSADPAALTGMAELQTSGQIDIPIVTLHTSGDPIVPFEQEALYAAKVASAGRSALLTQITIPMFGHCSFEAGDLLGAFSTLIGKVKSSAATARISAGFR
jgi:pimeloyl-ACP methyl ester carboxylesterase